MGMEKETIIEIGRQLGKYSHMLSTVDAMHSTGSLAGMSIVTTDQKVYDAVKTKYPELNIVLMKPGETQDWGRCGIQPEASSQFFDLVNEVLREDKTEVHFGFQEILPEEVSKTYSRWTASIETSSATKREKKVAQWKQKSSYGPVKGKRY
jgi:hypothetical protein